MNDPSRAWTALMKYWEEACQYFKERETLVSLNVGHEFVGGFVNKAGSSSCALREAAASRRVPIAFISIPQDRQSGCGYRYPCISGACQCVPEADLSIQLWANRRLE
jgi:hypothetical protein